MQKEIYNIPVVKLEDGELGFELPDNVLNKLNLKDGDTLLWTEQKDGSWILKKQ